MTGAPRFVITTVFAALALVTVGCRGNDATPPAGGAVESTRPVGAPHAATPEATRGFGSSVGFHSQRQLAEHFEKHGAEFDAHDEREYLREAQQLRDAPAGGSILEAVREDGVITRFDRRTGAFIAFDEDGTIRTFFKPNLGEQYFHRQARRHEERR